MPDERVIDTLQPRPRLWLGSVEFSAFEQRNGKITPGSGVLPKREISLAAMNRAASQHTEPLQQQQLEGLARFDFGSTGAVDDRYAGRLQVSEVTF